MSVQSEIDRIITAVGNAYSTETVIRFLINGTNAMSIPSGTICDWFAAYIPGMESIV